MSKVNMIGSDGRAFSTSLKNSRAHLANGTASLAEAAPAKVKKVAAKKTTARKAPAKKAASKNYRTRALKAKK